MLNTSDINHRTGIIVDAVMKVHTRLGPGLLESAYKACLEHELIRRKLAVLTEVAIRNGF
jgi:GxxExxY protein